MLTHCVFFVTLQVLDPLVRQPTEEAAVEPVPSSPSRDVLQPNIGSKLESSNYTTPLLGHQSPEKWATGNNHGSPMGTVA